MRHSIFIFHFFLIVLISTIAVESHAQCSDWERLIGYKEVSIRNMQRDKTGNLYVVGSFWSQNFRIGSTTIPFSGLYNSIFILKLDNGDNLVWAKSTGDGAAERIEIDGDGNIVVTGGFYAPSITFDCVHLINSSSRSDIFIVKFTPDGRAMWGAQSYGVNDEWPKDLEITYSGNIVVTGEFVAEGQVSFQGKTLTNFGGYDSFLTQLNSNGIVQWAFSIGGTEPNVTGEAAPDYIEAVDSDVEGNLIITGFFESPDLYIKNFSIPLNTVSENFFLAKMDSLGNVLWAKGANTTIDCGGYDVVVDKDKNVYVTGRFYEGQVTFGMATLTSQGYADIFLVKYDSDGNVIQAKSFGGEDFDTGYKLTSDQIGNIVMGGLYYSYVFSMDTFTAIKFDRHADIFIATLDNQLNTLCLKHTDGTGENLLSSLKCDPLNNLLITMDNIFYGTTEFGEGLFYSNPEIPSMIVMLGNNNDYEPIPPIVPFDVTIGNDIIICPGDEVILDPGGRCGVSYLWSDGSTQNTLATNQSGLYWVEAELNGVIAHDSVNISFHPPPFVNLGEDRIICSNESVLFNTTQTSLAEYHWNDGSSDPAKLITTPGLYWIEIKGQCQTVYDSVRIAVPPPLSVELGENQYICAGENLLLNANTPGAASYEWQDGSSLPELTVTQTGKYQVTISNRCEFKIDSVHITVIDLKDNLIIPNVVTPDGNHLNDTFILPAVLEGSHVIFFNRWGETIFTSNDYHNTWPEQEHPTGVYYFLLSGRCVESEMKGYVHLMKN